jgi:5-methylcytosine-specific restriction endonuclease McrA
MKRLRGRKLQERRKRLLMRWPLCVHCEAQGRVTVATVLDHIVALVNGGTDTEDNLQPLCDEMSPAEDRRRHGQAGEGADRARWLVQWGGPTKFPDARPEPACSAIERLGRATP